ncbi:hypothetical protein AMAG_13503 [Allomyces macrogynus ATCC 38327]|uniref:SHSP domain-containing protein n=1 Tax=Allomyces macrogynus (strain ATCC 38327) TaxID=578462 RepID=A0A0L0T2N6_ALLM3|nr:hypothetical protein AMAG_13503 [Allomyces macrogynus ATCC 38327]|eukprot:KNE68864.1 hypothetical protein AMAG_13503 [Allomyces macrogynus ATCC 38327]
MALFRPTEWGVGAGADPFGMDRAFRAMQRDMNRMLSDFIDTANRGGTTSAVGMPGVVGMGEMGFVPRIDVHETDKDIEVRCDLPGIPKDNVKVEANQGVLTISGESQAQGERREGTMHVRERYQGKFSRSVALPPAADLTNTKAAFHDGVLTVHVPKKAEAAGRRITIS